MCLTGEGSDEMFGGYLYFHRCPDAQQMQTELVRRVCNLYKYDLKRANKSMMAWGVEVRPPFLHKQFLDYVMNIHPSHKMCSTNPLKIEKYILRKAFDT